MIKQLRIVGEHYKVDDEMEQYVMQKLGQLDKYIPRHAKATAVGEVMLRQEKGKATGDYTVEAILDLPKERVTAKASGPSMYAAIDIVHDKIKHRLEIYKNEHSHMFYRHLINRLRGHRQG